MSPGAPRSGRVACAGLRLLVGANGGQADSWKLEGGGAPVVKVSGGLLGRSADAWCCAVLCGAVRASKARSTCRSSGGPGGGVEGTTKAWEPSGRECSDGRMARRRAVPSRASRGSNKADRGGRAEARFKSGLAEAIKPTRCSTTAARERGRLSGRDGGPTRPCLAGERGRERRE